MNPNDMFLAQPSTSSLFAGPGASTSQPPAGGVAPLQNGAHFQPMQLDPSAAFLDALPPPPPEKPKIKKEQEQDRKDLELAELLETMDEWRPIIPDEVTDYYLQRSGFETSDPRVKRLLALAAQRFVSSISADAYQYARTRTAAGSGGGSGTKGGAGGGSGGGSKAKDRTKTVLTMEDLSAALKEYGVGADRAQYYL